MIVSVSSATFLFTYLLSVDRLKYPEAGWIQVSTEGDCLVNSSTNIWLTAGVLYGNLVFIIFICVMDIIPLMRYIRDKYLSGRSVVNIEKYVEIIAFKARVAVM